MFYFLKEDFEALNREIASICKRMEGIGKDVGTTREAGNKFHDDFTYEEGQRQQLMWSKRIRDLLEIRNEVQIIEPEPEAEKVKIGRTVTIKNKKTGEIRTFHIGSYMVFTGQREGQIKRISYKAPIVRIILYGVVGETRRGEIADEIIELKILKIE